MFETIKTAPPDPILGLTEAFNQDPNPNKINLAVGVYKDGSRPDTGAEHGQGGRAASAPEARRPSHTCRCRVIQPTDL